MGLKIISERKSDLIIMTVRKTFTIVTFVCLSGYKMWDAYWVQLWNYPKIRTMIFTYVIIRILAFHQIHLYIMFFFEI